MSNPDRYAVIGHPVSHSRSPFIPARFAAQTRHTLSYTTIDATPADFARTVREFFTGGGKGLNVTIPHKELAARFAVHPSTISLIARGKFWRHVQ